MALLATIAGLVLALVVCLLTAAVTRVVEGTGRAQDVADAAALAVLSGSPLVDGDGRPALDAAHRVAQANGLVLVAVDLDGWPLGVRASVHPGVDLAAPFGGLLLPPRWGAARLVPP